MDGLEAQSCLKAELSFMTGIKLNQMWLDEADGAARGEFPVAEFMTTIEVRIFAM